MAFNERSLQSKYVRYLENAPQLNRRIPDPVHRVVPCQQRAPPYVYATRRTSRPGLVSGPSTTFRATMVVSFQKLSMQQSTEVRFERTVVYKSPGLTDSPQRRLDATQLAVLAAARRQHLSR